MTSFRKNLAKKSLKHYVNKASNSTSFLPVITHGNSSIDSTNRSINISENSLETPGLYNRKNGAFSVLGKENTKSIDMAASSTVLRKASINEDDKHVLPKLQKKNSILRKDSFLLNSSQKLSGFLRDDEQEEIVFEMTKLPEKSPDKYTLILETEEDDLKLPEQKSSPALNKGASILKNRGSFNFRRQKEEQDKSGEELQNSIIGESRNAEKLNEIINMVRQLKTFVKERNKIEIMHIIDRIRNKGDEITVFNFKLELSHVLAQLFLKYGDISNSLKYLKLFRDYCKFLNKPSQKLKAYKFLALVYQNLNRFEKAITYLKKMLKLSWLLKRIDFELLAYDLIGKQFYYMANLKKATFFHNRMMKGVVEPKDSVIRRVGEEALKAKDRKSEAHKNILLLNRANSHSRGSVFQQNSLSDSEDSFDLDIFTLSTHKGQYNPDEPNRQHLIDLSHALYKQRNKDIVKNAMPPRREENKDESRNLKIQERIKRLVIPPKNVSEKILLNHLSPCRDIHNYNLVQFQNVTSHQENESSKVFLKNEASVIKLLTKFEKFIEKMSKIDK